MAPSWPHLKSHHTAAEHHFPFPQGTRGTLRTLVWVSEIDQCEGVQGKTAPPIPGTHRWETHGQLEWEGVRAC